MPTAPSREWILWLLTEIFVEVEREQDAFNWFCGFCCTIKLQSPVYQSVFQLSVLKPCEGLAEALGFRRNSFCFPLRTVFHHT